MQVEEKLYDDIIKLSQKKIMALELLCNFFKNKVRNSMLMIEI